MALHVSHLWLMPWNDNLFELIGKWARWVGSGSLDSRPNPLDNRWRREFVFDPTAQLAQPRSGWPSSSPGQPCPWRSSIVSQWSSHTRTSKQWLTRVSMVCGREKRLTESFMIEPNLCWNSCACARMAGTCSSAWLECALSQHALSASVGGRISMCKHVEFGVLIRYCAFG